VFDAPEIADGVGDREHLGLHDELRRGHKLTDADLSTVAVIRTPRSDGVRRRDVGQVRAREARQGEGPGDQEVGASESVLARAPGDAAARPTRSRRSGARDDPLGCALAAGRVARTVAERTKQKPDVVQAEMRAHLLPGLVLQPSGIYAVTRAQEAGCSFVRST
jgi:hypothetical protein